MAVTGWATANNLGATRWIFSANVSPLGLPKGVADAITAALPQADRYPDPLCRTLRAALSEAEGLPADQILCGNGAADLIFRLALAVKPRRALVTAPTFAEYATALETVGCTVERFALNEANDFAVTEEFLDAIVPGVEIVFLCQPNNPTGQLASPALVRRAAERCAACGAVLAVDECFLDFLPDGDRWTAKPLLHEDQNLIIFKAFTKLYGMAGVRLGYCLSADAALLEKNAERGPALGGVQPGSGRRCGGPERNGVRCAGAGPHCSAEAETHGRPAGAGPAGDRGQGQLFIAARAGDSRRAAAAKGGCPARLRQLSRAGRQLVPALPCARGRKMNDC